MNFDFNKLNKKITIVELTTQNIGGVSKKVEKEVCKLYAFFDTVWAKDYQTAVNNNTQNQIRIVVRQIPVEIDTNKCTIKYENKSYKIIQILPDYYENCSLSVNPATISDVVV